MSHMCTPAINAQCLKVTVLVPTLSFISCGSFFIVKRASESVQLQPMLKPRGHHKWASDESIRTILHLLHYWWLLEGKTNMSRVPRGLQWEPIKESHFSVRFVSGVIGHVDSEYICQSCIWVPIIRLCSHTVQWLTGETTTFHNRTYMFRTQIHILWKHALCERNRTGQPVVRHVMVSVTYSDRDMRVSDPVTVLRATQTHDSNAPLSSQIKTLPSVNRFDR